LQAEIRVILDISPEAVVNVLGQPNVAGTIFRHLALRFGAAV
jgi:hypothetical protein